MNATTLTIQIHKTIHGSFTLIKGKITFSDYITIRHITLAFFFWQAITDATLLASRAARITSMLNQKQSLSDVSMQSVAEPMENSTKHEST